MSTDLTLFTHPVFGDLRTIVDGETIYICAKDAATALGYSNTNDAIKRHCKVVVKRYPLETPGGTQEFAFIYESDLYRLIIGSKLPAARQFESWVRARRVLRPRGLPVLLGRGAHTGWSGFAQSTTARVVERRSWTPDRPPGGTRGGSCPGRVCPQGVLDVGSPMSGAARRRPQSPGGALRCNRAR